MGSSAHRSASAGQLGAARRCRRRMFSSAHLCRRPPRPDRFPAPWPCPPPWLRKQPMCPHVPPTMATGDSAVATHHTYMHLHTYTAHRVPRAMHGLSREGRRGLDLAQNMENPCGVLYVVEATM